MSIIVETPVKGTVPRNPNAFYKVNSLALLLPHFNCIPNPHKAKMVYISHDFKEGITKKDVDPLLPYKPKKAPPPIDRSDPVFAPKHANHLIVYTLELSDDGSPDFSKRYVRLPAPIKPYVVRFKVVAGSLASNKGVFYTNYSIDGTEFGRKKFHAVKFTADFSVDSFCDVHIERPGAFEYYVEYEPLPGPHPAEPSHHPAKRVKSQHGYFVVDPKLYIKTPTRVLSEVPTNSAATVPLPIDGLVIESVVPKWLGHFRDWGPQLKGLADLGYNMVHFVPIQKRGGSNSPYSIFDQLQFADDLFDEKERNLPDTQKLEIVKNELGKIKEEYGLMIINDVVWNHTSDDSTWLWEHPEAGYSPHNSPHLTAALELDTALLEFSSELSTKYDLPTTITSAKDIDNIITVLKDKVLPAKRLWDFYTINMKESVAELLQVLADASIEYDKDIYKNIRLRDLSLKEQAIMFREDAFTQTVLCGRHNKKAKMEVVIAFVFNLANVNGYEELQERNLQALAGLYGQVLDEVNLPFYKQYDADIEVALENIRNRLEYQHLADHGPKVGVVDEAHPLIDTYFTRLPVNEVTKHWPKSMLALVNNGWIWNADPLQDFAGPQSSAYLRREIIVWGDCVKLRYGSGPEDNPWLWEHMRKYTERVAQLFEGVRIDNCHSTPLHVAQYLLDAARVIKPNLYVVAELFTGSEGTDVTFISKLGINSLIREAMQAWDPKELSRLVHRHGGKPVGSMDAECLTEEIKYRTKDGKDVPAVIIPLQGSGPHALFMDCTHDNETPTEKRTPEDTLSTAALVAFSACATGSVKGFDEIYPKHLDIVGESRLYERPEHPAEVAIGRAKSILQRLHVEMTLDGYIETHVHHEGDYIIVHRQDPVSHQGYLLVTHTAFPGTMSQRGNVSPIQLRGTEVEHIFAAHLIVTRTISDDPEWLHGLPASLDYLGVPVIRHRVDVQGPFTEIVVPSYFPSGSIMLFKTWIEHSKEDIDVFVTTGCEESMNHLGLLEMNVVLYRCNGEETDLTPGNGTYNIPDYGEVVYCGLEGFMSVLRPIIRNNDLGHALCNHLRQGQWALDYVSGRLERHMKFFPKLEPLHQWFISRHEVVKTLPNFLLPKYFALIQKTAYSAARQHALSLMAPFIREGDFFTQSLALCSVQMHGITLSTGLQPDDKNRPSLAAGLPHFGHGHMRTWGRDVFISLRGLFLTTNNFAAAKAHITAFASCLKHGLIPNLLDASRFPRYNARDAVWWFLQALQDYYTLAPDGAELLQTTVKRRFPLDDTWVLFDDSHAYSHTSTIGDIIQEIFQRHAQGIHFREYNAGPDLDRQMSDAGFNVDVDVDWTTGFVFGGSQFNCGTWMDKMGESEKAGNKGIPATPRDGADVEIIGLLKSALRWVVDLNAANKYKWTGVEATVKGTKKTFTFKEWNALVQTSFEKCFYIPKDPADDTKYSLTTKLINRRGMYKDIYKCSKEFSDYELRPNFPVAMVVAPELFNPQHAIGALQIAYQNLAGPLGVRTLDPADWAYRPEYDNSNDSDDRALAKGWNYHQGPEWVWCTGYFLRAYLHYDIEINCKLNDKNLPDAMLHIHRLLLAHKEEIKKNAWAGLPELTNKDGEVCWDSCPTQAWSASTMLDLLHDMVRRYSAHVKK